MGTVDVLNIKDAAQTEEQDFGQCWSQLRGGDQHIDAVLPLGNHAETLERQGGPIIGGHLDFGAYLQPGISFSRSQQSAHTARDRESERDVRMSEISKYLRSDNRIDKNKVANSLTV